MEVRTDKKRIYLRVVGANYTHGEHIKLTI